MAVDPEVGRTDWLRRRTVMRGVRPTIDQAVDVAHGKLPIELRPLVGMDLPAYTLGGEVDGVATVSKGGVAVGSGEGSIVGISVLGTRRAVQVRW
jgi:hypothetical protein